MTSTRSDHVESSLRQALAGEYAVERELARGAMARIFVARDLRHGRTVAIKVLPPDLATASTAERFLREIRITADLQHPSILPLLDSGASAGLCWYVMPLVEGVSLRQRLSEGPLPLRDALRIAILVGQALEHAHQRGIIHRDIKPENILFSGRHPMVADFGLARAVAGSLGAGITATGLPLGTPAYMSPEQASGSTDVDHRADLYALGCVLFEMVTGRVPFAGRSVMDVIRQHMEQVAPTVASLRPGTPAALDRIVARLLAKRKEDRYQQAADVVTDLENVLARLTVEGEPGAAPVGEPAARAPETAPVKETPATRRTWIWAVAIAAVLGLGFLVWRLTSGGGGGAQAQDVSVAVLPLQAVGGDSVARTVADGLSSELAAELISQGGIRVGSPIAAAVLMSRGLTPREVADSLKVNHLYFGEVVRQGDQVRVSLELIHSSTDAAEWAKSWDGVLSELLSLRRRVAQEAAAALRQVTSQH
ncbi:MAG TPA: serine/threonine-protein kinase [Gemmatimonadales bacterium]